MPRDSTRCRTRDSQRCPPHCSTRGVTLSAKTAKGPTGSADVKRDRPVAYIVQERCDRSASCPVMRICPKNAVVPDQTDAPIEKPKGLLASLFGGGSGSGQAWVVNEDLCSGCLLCAPYCPHGAVEPRPRTGGA